MGACEVGPGLQERTINNKYDCSAAVGETSSSFPETESSPGAEEQGRPVLSLTREEDAALHVSA